MGFPPVTSGYVLSMSSRTQTVTATSLAAYLNDHLAGSTAGIELVTRLGAENEGTPLGETLARLATEIDADRSTLQDLMARLDIRPQLSKRAGAWVIEKISRVRFVPSLTGNAATSRLMQLETLSLGIEGKRLLWKALTQLSDPRLAPFDLDRLQGRAEAQRDLLEPFRLEAAAAGLG
jgi:hypothetical protein